MLLGRPDAPGIETVNDLDAFIANFFRALAAAPDEVAWWCDKPVNEADMTAIHLWLLAQCETCTARLFGDPDYYDAKIAGRWVYGLCCWIGSGWCSGNGPWHSVDGQLMHLGDAGDGVKRTRVHLGKAGQGVHRQRVHLGDAGDGVKRTLVHLGDAGKGVHRKRVHLGDAGQGSPGLSAWFAALAARLRHVRVCCGDWTRILSPSVTYQHGLTGIVLDPPYSTEEGRDMRLYRQDSGTVAHEVRAWCLAEGHHPLLRIVLCGYGDIHDALLAQGWTKAYWKANGGMSNIRKQGVNHNKERETLWFSPACLSEEQGTLFAMGRHGHALD